MSSMNYVPGSLGINSFSHHGCFAWLTKTAPPESGRRCGLLAAPLSFGSCWPESDRWLCVLPSRRVCLSQDFRLSRLVEASPTLYFPPTSSVP